MRDNQNDFEIKYVNNEKLNRSSQYEKNFKYGLGSPASIDGL